MKKWITATLTASNLAYWSCPHKSCEEIHWASLPIKDRSFMCPKCSHEYSILQTQENRLLIKE